MAGLEAWGAGDPPQLGARSSAVTLAQLGVRRGISRVREGGGGTGLDDGSAWRAGRKLPHIQLNWWRIGVKAGDGVKRIPLPWL